MSTTRHGACVLARGRLDLTGRPPDDWVGMTPETYLASGPLAAPGAARARRPCRAAPPAARRDLHGLPGRRALSLPPAQALRRLRARSGHPLPGRHGDRHRLRLERLDPRRRRRPQLAPRPLRARGAGGRLGQGHEHPALDVAGAHGHGRARRRRLSPARALAVLERVRLLPWAVLGGVVPPIGEDAPPDVRALSRPALRLRHRRQLVRGGTLRHGSKDLLVDDAFVPEYRTHSYRDAFFLTNPGAVVNDGPLYHLPFGLVFPACIGVAGDRRRPGSCRELPRANDRRVSPRDQAGSPRIRSCSSPSRKRPPR